MKKNLLTLLFALTLAVACGCANVYSQSSAMNYKSIAAPFVSAEGRFSTILVSGFPEFTYEKHPKPVNGTIVQIHQYSSETVRGNFVVAYYDLPLVGTLKEEEITKVLESTRDQLTEGSTVISKESLTVDGYQGVSVLFEVQHKIGTIYVRCNYVMAQPRIYNYIFVSTNRAEMDKPDVLSFFNSFHIGA